MLYRETGRKRDRDTDRKRDRATERQRDRGTERQRDREAERQRGRERRQRERETEGQRRGMLLFNNPSTNFCSTIHQQTVNNPSKSRQKAVKQPSKFHLTAPPEHKMHHKMFSIVDFFNGFVFEIFFFKLWFLCLDGRCCCYMP